VPWPNGFVVIHVENDGRDPQRLDRRRLEKVRAGFDGAETRMDIESLAREV